MRKFILAVLLQILVLPFYLQCQSLSLFNIDATNFPIVKSNFYAYNKLKQQIIDIKPENFHIYEKGIERKVLSVYCPHSNAQIISLALSIDISGSMNPDNIEFAKLVAQELVNSINKPSNIAIQVCNSRALLYQDFTDSTELLLERIENIYATGENNFVEQLLNPKTGVLNIVKAGTNKRVVILLTDAKWTPLNASELKECIDICKTNNITFYAIFFTPKGEEQNGIKTSLKALASETKGRLIDGILNTNEARELGVELQGEIQGGKPCTLEWESNGCDIEREALVNLVIDSLFTTVNYTVPQEFLPKFSFDPDQTISFGEVDPGKKPVKSINITSKGKRVVIYEIKKDNDRFRIANYDSLSFPYILEADSVLTLKIEFAPIDYYYESCKFEIISDACSGLFFYAKGGSPWQKPDSETLRITHPNGREVFFSGSDTTITWEGISPLDTVSLEYSIDNGTSWRLLTRNATGLAYRWKDIPPTPSKQCLARVFHGNAEPSWIRKAGCTGWDESFSIATLPAGNSYITGAFGMGDSVIRFENSILLTSMGRKDVFLANYNSKGQCSWARSMGSRQDDIPSMIISDNQGNACIGGISCDSATFGNGITLADPGAKAYFITKFDNTGTCRWARQFLTNDMDSLPQNYGLSLVSDKVNNLYIAGNFREAIYFEEQTGMTGNWVTNFFLTRFTPEGRFVWARSVTGSALTSCNSLMINKTGDLFLTGNFLYEAYFEPHIVINQGSPSIFIAKYSTDGFCIWAKTFDAADGISLASNVYGENFIIGSFQGNLDLGNGVKLYSKEISRFLAMFDDDGNFYWARQISGGFISNKSMACDPMGNIILTGSFNGLLDFVGQDFVKSTGVKDLFVAKLDRKGTLKWINVASGSPTINSNQASTDNQGNIFLTGGFNGIMKIGDSDPINGYSDESDVFLLRFNDKDSYSTDVSDTLWTIAKPKVTAFDINVGKQLKGYPKDTLVIKYLVNEGNCQVRIEDVSFIGTNPADFALTSPIPPFDIKETESKDFEFRFTPSDIGSRDAVIRIITQSDTIYQNITGEGIEPVLKVDPDFIDFGRVAVNSFKDTILALISNIGSAPVLITNTALTGPDDEQFRILSGGGSFILNPKESRTLKLEFAPIMVGRTSGSISFYYDGTGSPAKAMLFGEGIIASPSLVIYSGDPPRLVCDTSTTFDIELKNAGGQDLEIYDITFEGSDAGDFNLSLPFSPFTLKPAQAGALSIVFHRTGGGTSAAAMVIKSNSIPDSILKYPISGIKEVIAFDIPQDTLDFGFICPEFDIDTIARQLNIRNLSSMATKLIMQSGDSPFYTEIPNIMEKDFDVGETRIINYKLIPGRITGDTVVTITFRDSCGNQYYAVLKAGLAKFDAVYTNSLDFGRVLAGGSKDSAVTIENKNDPELIISNWYIKGGTAGPFKVSGTLPMTLAKGISRDIGISFNPTDAGLVIDTLVLEAYYPCRKEIDIALTGAGVCRTTIRIPEIKAQVGEKIIIPIEARIENKVCSDAYEYEAKISFDARAFLPENISNGTLTGNSIINGERILSFTGTTPGLQIWDTEIASIEGTVLLSDLKSTSLKISNWEWKNDYIETQKYDGRLIISDICQSGLTRFNVFTTTTVEINPNPADNEFELIIRTMEKGNLHLEIFTLEGDRIYECEIELPGTNDPGTICRIIDLRNFTQGCYEVVATTQSEVFRKSLVIIK